MIVYESTIFDIETRDRLLTRARIADKWPFLRFDNKSFFAKNLFFLQKTPEIC